MIRHSNFDCAEVVPTPTKIIVGSGRTFQQGWLSLQHSDLDIRSRRGWQNRFSLNSLDAVLCEHVLEHLDMREAEMTANNIWEFIRCGGRWRIAVPDGFHPHPNYLNWVAPNSTGERFLKIFRHPSEPDHKLLWNYQALVSFLSGHGFKVVLLEYFDGRGVFHRSNWNEADGRIWRRAGSGWSNFLSTFVNAPYTSLIADAIKVCK